MKALRTSLFVLTISVAASFAQITPDPQILAEVNRIKAVDNHTHVPKVVDPGARDEEFDALPCDPLEPSETPAMARPSNPLFLEAWKKLYGYKYNDRDPAHVQELLVAKRRVASEQGDNFPTWVIDHMGIEYMFANRVAMGRGLNSPRFVWVPFDDALMFPLDNRAMADNPDRKIFYTREEALLKKYMSEASVPTLPGSLEEYISKVIVPTLERQKKAGALAIKFEASYLRSLDFGEAEPDEARKVYSRAVKETPSRADYIKVQNVLFRQIVREAGRLGLVVHIHTGTGCGGYFDLPGSNPGLLDSVLNDASVRGTKIVIVHGGSGPYTKVATFLLGKPNVYADFSEQDALLSVRAMSEVIRDWLETYPEKVMFGTDLAPGDDEIGWPEIGYANMTTGREGLALALTGMMNDGELTRDEALKLARMVLRENALKLYHLAP